jgi:eukaryotic-like serine/threonine-protein kinase
MLKGVLAWLRGSDKSGVDKDLRATALLTSIGRDDVFHVDTNIQERLPPRGELGRGGMCVVHDTLDLHLLRHSALKVMHEDVAATPSMHGRFVVEARITAQLEHPNIIPVHEFGQDAEGVPYINMRKVSGDTLEFLAELEDEQRLTPINLKRVLHLLERVCEAIGYAHSRGVLHLDVKPDNIMVGDFGQIYVVDWGVALCRPEFATDDPVRTSGPGEPDVQFTSIGGTPAYMAPEQAAEQVDQLGPWTDVFLIGATLYHLVAGRPPHPPGGGRDAILRRIGAGEFTPLGEATASMAGIPAGLVSIVERAMSHDPTKRYASAVELGEDLVSLLETGSAGCSARSGSEPGHSSYEKGTKASMPTFFAPGSVVCLSPMEA